MLACALGLDRSQRAVCGHATGGAKQRQEEEEGGEEDQGHHPTAGHDVTDGRYWSSSSMVLLEGVLHTFFVFHFSHSPIPCVSSGQSIPEEEVEEEEVEEEYTDESDNSDIEDRGPPGDNQSHLMPNQRMPPPSGPMGAQQGPPHMQGPPLTGPPPLGPPPAPPMRPPGPPSGPPPGPPPGDSTRFHFSVMFSRTALD